MRLLYNPIWPSFPYLTWVAAIDILFVAYLIYQFLMIVRGRRAAHILAGVVILSAIYGIARIAQLELVRSILANIVPYAPFAVIVMFQSEIRRLLARIGRRRWVSLGGKLQKRELAEEVALTLKQLSELKTGALIVIERDIGLRSFIESGVALDASLSRDLLLTIFRNGSALHDGAVIIRGDRIAAANCFLPLSVRPAIARSLGTRHRAAIGVTEETDCLSIIVSEETGCISVAAFGEIQQDISPDQLEKRITEHIIGKREPHPSRRSADREEERLEREAARDAHAD